MNHYFKAKIGAMFIDSYSTSDGEIMLTIHEDQAGAFEKSDIVAIAKISGTSSLSVYQVELVESPIDLESNFLKEDKTHD